MVRKDAWCNSSDLRERMVMDGDRYVPMKAKDVENERKQERAYGRMSDKITKLLAGQRCPNREQIIERIRHDNQSKKEQS